MIRFIFRWAFRLLILLIVLVVAGILLLDTFAREYTEYQIRKETGMEVKIGKMHVGLTHPEMTIENMTIYNRPEFGGSPFVEMPELHVEYDRDALASRKLRCRLVRFNLSRINVVEDKKGRRNMDKLQAMAPAANGKSKNSSQLEVDGVKFVGIDTLNLTLGKVTFTSMKQPRQSQEVDLKVDHQVFTGIKSVDDFNGILFVALLKSGANIFPTSGNNQSFLQLFSAPKK